MMVAKLKTNPFPWENMPIKAMVRKMEVLETSKPTLQGIFDLQDIKSGLRNAATGMDEKQFIMGQMYIGIMAGFSAVTGYLYAGAALIYKQFNESLTGFGISTFILLVGVGGIILREKHRDKKTEKLVASVKAQLRGADEANQRN